MRIIEKTANTTVVEIGGNTVLFSYTTPVAALIPGRGYVKSDGVGIVFRSNTGTHHGIGRTTSKHIGQFLDGMKAEVVPQSYLNSLSEGK